MPRTSCRLARVALIAALAASAGCSKRNGASAATEEPATTLLVENSSSFEMTIYVLRGAERVRLGTARASMDSRLRLPRGLVFGATPLRFQADPIGSPRTPISQEILVRPGDEVTLRIPPR
jgi:hypothetical protein